MAAALGFGTIADSTPDADAALTVKQRWAHGPGDRGASVVFQCRGQASALATALRCVRPQGVVVDLAFYAAGAEEVRLGEEFHHNGLVLRCAQIGRVPRGLTASWDRERLSRATIELLRARRVDPPASRDRRGRLRRRANAVRRSVAAPPSRRRCGFVP